MKDPFNLPDYVISLQINLTAQQLSAVWRELKPLIPVLISGAIGGALLLPPMLTAFNNAHPVPPPVERDE